MTGTQILKLLFLRTRPNTGDYKQCLFDRSFTTLRPRFPSFDSHPDRSRLHVQIKDLVTHVAAGNALQIDPWNILICVTASTFVSWVIAGTVTNAGPGARRPLELSGGNLSRRRPVETSNLRAKYRGMVRTSDRLFSTEASFQAARFIGCSVGNLRV